MANTQVGEPPIYTGDTSGFVGPLPGTRESGNGTDALFATMLTMRLAQQHVDAAYANGGSSLSVYTTGIDATGAVAYLLDTPAGQVNRDLTAMVGGAEIDLRENLNEGRSGICRSCRERPKQRSRSTSMVRARAASRQSRSRSPVVNGLLDASDPTVLSCVEHYFPRAKRLRSGLGVRLRPRRDVVRALHLARRRRRIACRREPHRSSQHAWSGHGGRARQGRAVWLHAAHRRARSAGRSR